MTTQMSLLEETDVELTKPDPMTTVQVGSRIAQIPLHKRRRETCNRLMEILQELEGKDIHIGSYDAGGRHYWVQSLKLPRLPLLRSHQYNVNRRRPRIQGKMIIGPLWTFPKGACYR